MGRYVCVGIQNKVSVPKSRLDEFKDDYTHEELLAHFEQTNHMTDVFERSETDDAYVYQLKDEILEKELLPKMYRSALMARFLWNIMLLFLDLFAVA